MNKKITNVKSKKKIRFRIRYILIAFVVFVILKVVLKQPEVKKTFSFLFNVKKIEVLNFNVVDSSRIITGLSYLKGKNIFNLNKEDIKDTLISLIGTKDIKIRKVLTNKIVIEKIVKVPAAITQINGKVFYIDKDGVLRNVGFGKIYDVPFVTGLSLDTLRKGIMRVNKNNWFEYKKFISLCTKKGIKVNEIEHIKFGCFDVKMFLKNINSLIVLPKDNCNVAVDNLVILLGRLSKEEKARIKKIDFSSAKLAFVK